MPTEKASTVILEKSPTRVLSEAGSACQHKTRNWSYALQAFSSYSGAVPTLAPCPNSWVHLNPRVNSRKNVTEEGRSLI